MTLPFADKAWIPREKLKKYLLNPDHPTGGAKAKFFCQLGYTRENMEELEWRLLELGRSGEIMEKVDTRYGTKYVLEGDLEGIHDKRKRVKTVWILEEGIVGPRLVTAYPA